MNVQHYHDFELSSFLLDDSPRANDAALQQHLENCVVCQQQFAELAAAEVWWTKAAAHLSTMEQLKIPADIIAQLSNSAAIFVPSSLARPWKPHNRQREALDCENRRPSLATTASDTAWHHILDPPTHPEMLGRIDQFEIEGKIGSGGMGIVLKGLDRNLNRAVAIKVLAPHLASNGTARQRFAREAQAAAAVVHPNVVPIYAVKACETRPYIVMQLVSGHSLQTLVQEKGPLHVKEIVRIGIQVADGLAAAHQQGLIHRDIKPANILIEQDVSRVMITDFGLARATDDAGITQSGWIAGTPHYMSPEQSSGENLDCRTDLFSLGGLLYFLATGREPFRGEKPFAVIQKIINEPPISPRELNSDLPAMISDVIERLLEKKPDDRFQSATAVRQWLENYLAYLQQPMSVAQPQRVLTRRRRRIRNWKLTTMVGSAVLLATATIWFRFSASNVVRPNSTSALARVSNSAGRGPESSNIVNSAASESDFGSTFLPGIFEDETYFREVEDLDRQISDLEQRVQESMPFAIPDPVVIETGNQVFGEIQDLQSITTRWLEEESLEHERLQSRLDAQRGDQGIPPHDDLQDTNGLQKPADEPQPDSDHVKSGQPATRQELLDRNNR